MLAAQRVSLFPPLDQDPDMKIRFEHALDWVENIDKWDSTLWDECGSDTFNGDIKEISTGHWTATGFFSENSYGTSYTQICILKGGLQGKPPSPAPVHFETQIFVNDIPYEFSEKVPGCLPVAR